MDLSRWFAVGVVLLLVVCAFFGWLWVSRPPDRLFVASRVWLSLAKSGHGISDSDAQNLAGLILRDLGREVVGEDFDRFRRVYAPGVVTRGNGCAVRVENASLKVGNIELHLHSMCIDGGRICLEVEVKGLKEAVSPPGLGRIYPDMPFTLMVSDRGIERGSEGCLH